LPLDQPEDLFVRGDSSLGQIPQIGQDTLAPPEIAERQFAGYEWMSKHLARLKQGGKPLIGSPQVIYPDGRIDQDHFAFTRRRGIGRKSGSVPPRRANRRAASRCTRAVRASRSSADLSFIPV
jgi:hypothetical protein